MSSDLLSEKGYGTTLNCLLFKSEPIFQINIILILKPTVVKNLPQLC